MKSKLRKSPRFDDFNDPYGIRDSYVCRHYSTPDKDEEIRTFLHYSEPDAREERDVFGQAKKGLFYNYDDRLIGERWTKGWELAKSKGLKLKTARFYEEVLKYFHDSDDVNLQHIILGCNMSNGYSYLVFGYTYTSKSGQ